MFELKLEKWQISPCIPNVIELNPLILVVCHTDSKQIDIIKKSLYNLSRLQKKILLKKLNTGFITHHMTFSIDLLEYMRAVFFSTSDHAVIFHQSSGRRQHCTADNCILPLPQPQPLLSIRRHPELIWRHVNIATMIVSPIKCEL